MDSVFIVITAIVLAFGAVKRPEQARCPRGWWVPEGIRRNGSFECKPPVIGGEDDVLTGKQTSIQPPEAIRGQIYCTPPAVPVFPRRLDGELVGCRRI